MWVVMATCGPYTRPSSPRWFATRLTRASRAALEGTYATLNVMRAVVAWLVAAVSGLALLTPVAAAPPEDVAAYCRAVYPQVQFQVRCLNVEHAAAERVSQSAAGADRDAFNRCMTASPSWAAMESCLAPSARGAVAGGVGGVMSPTAPGADPGAVRSQDATRPPA